MSRLQLVIVSALLVAGCGSDGADDAADADAATTDGGAGADASTADASTADASTQCVAADATGAAMIAIVNQEVIFAGQGGTLVSGTWELDEAVMDPPLTVTGTVQGAIDLQAADGTTGALALDAIVTITAPFATGGAVSGDGDYATSGAQITLTANPACTNQAPIDMGEFTATPTEITLWANVTVMGFTIPTRLHFTKE